MNFARLNHVLIPTTKAERDKLRRSPIGRALSPLLAITGWLSLEGKVFAGLIALVSAAALDVAGTQVYVLWSALVGLLFASLCLRPFFALTKVEVKVRGPHRVTVGETLGFEIELTNRGQREHQALRVEGPFLPWDGRWTTPHPRVRLLGPKSSEVVRVGARFVQRGPHHLDPFRVCALVPFGFALGPGLLTAGWRFLVVPTVTEVRSLQLGFEARAQPGGVARSSRVGEAMELVGVRPYRFGDRTRDLHARTWARTGTPHVREYRDEQFLRVGLACDPFAALDERAFEAALSLAAGVATHLTSSECLVDLVLPRRGATSHVTIGRGVATIELALDSLAMVEPGEPEAPAEVLSQWPLPRAQVSAWIVIVAGDAQARRWQEDLASMGLPGRVLVVSSEKVASEKSAPPGDGFERLDASTLLGREPVHL